MIFFYHLQANYCKKFFEKSQESFQNFTFPILFPMSKHNYTNKKHKYLAAPDNYKNSIQPGTTWPAEDQNSSPADSDNEKPHTTQNREGKIRRRPATANQQTQTMKIYLQASNSSAISQRNYHVVNAEVGPPHRRLTLLFGSPEMVQITYSERDCPF